MLGLLALPFAGVLMARHPAGELRSRAESFRLRLAVAGLVDVLVFALSAGAMMFPGDSFGNWGLGSTHNMPGLKPALFPLPLFYLLEAAVTLAFLVILGMRRRMWPGWLKDPSRLVMLGCALTQLLPMLITSPTDRYYLAVAAPLLPLFAAEAERRSRHQTAAKAWLVISLLGGLVLFGAGEQDYLAWQVARAAAARIAYRAYPADRVDTGYETVATNFLVPNYEATGRTGIGALSVHLAHPAAVLAFAGPRSTQQGVSYHSLASGRVVLRRAP